MRFPTIVGDRDPILRAGRRAMAGALVGAVVGLSISGLWYASRPVKFSSTVALELTLVAPIVDLNPTGPTVNDVTVDTDAIVVVADPVVSAVANAVNRDPAVVRKSITVRARPLSRVVEITYTTRASPEAAREGVTAAAEAYLDLRERLIIDPAKDYVDGVVSETDRVQRETVPVGDSLTGGQTALERRLERGLAYEIRLPAPGSVIASASAPTARRGTIDVILMSGGALGALLGFGVGLIAERRTRRPTRAGVQPAVNA